MITTRCRPTQYPIMELKSLSASGMEVEELLYELQTCGLSISSGEAVELYKDVDYTDWTDGRAFKETVTAWETV